MAMTTSGRISLVWAVSLENITDPVTVLLRYYGNCIISIYFIRANKEWGWLIFPSPLDLCLGRYLQTFYRSSNSWIPPGVTAFRILLAKEIGQVECQQLIEHYFNNFYMIIRLRNVDCMSDQQIVAIYVMVGTVNMKMNKVLTMARRANGPLQGPIFFPGCLLIIFLCTRFILVGSELNSPFCRFAL